MNTLFKKASITEKQLVCSNDSRNGQKGLTVGVIITIFILSLLGSIVLLGTIIDLLLKTEQQSIDSKASNINGHDTYLDIEEAESESESIELSQKSTYNFSIFIDPTSRLGSLAEFSAIRTLRRIFTMKQKNDDDSFIFINGIRVLALFWVIMGHSVAFGLSYTSNIVDLLVWTRNASMQLIINALLSVDTFFVLSGFLTAILFIRQVKKENKLSFRLFIFYYVYRYIRLTPTLLLMILVSINLTAYFGQGPVYPTEKGFGI